jgi:membrane-associated protease RseP (regulator of RpoE activity)
VELRPGETAHVTLRSRGTGTVTGTVTELGTHAPIAGMRCDAILSMGGQMSAQPPDESQQAFADATGHFTVAAPLGRVRIFCFVPTGGPFSGAGADVDVASGTPAVVNEYAVRSTFGGAPSDPGFMFAMDALPLTVGGVLPGGPAAAAGMLVGDQVVAIDDVPTAGLMPQGAMFLLANHKPGSVATVTVERSGESRILKIAIAAGHP